MIRRGERTIKAYGVWIDKFCLGEGHSTIDRKIFFDKNHAIERANDIERDGAELSLQAKRCEECHLYDDIGECINYVPWEEDVYAHVVEFEVEDLP